MNKFEILCVTMHQNDLSKIKTMNVHSDIVFANQADSTSYVEEKFDGHKAKLITTSTRGVGNNRNLSLIYASADICLLSDDDMSYVDNYEKIILNAFEKLPNADVIIFNIKSSDETGVRQPYQIKRVSKFHKWSRNPYGGPRIAFRLKSIQNKNIWFTQLFGGGAKYSHGEDTMFINDCLSKGLNIFLVPELIGYVDYGVSTWYDGYNEKVLFDQGALLAANHKWLYRFFYRLYFAFRIRERSRLSYSDRILWMKCGESGYKAGTGYNESLENRDR